MTKVRLQEWSRHPSESGKLLTGVTLPDDPHTRALILDLDRRNKLQILEFRHGLSIQSSSFVGRITLGTLEITIQPKLKGLPLMRLLRYAYGLRRIEQVGNSDFETAAQTFQDLLIIELAREAERLIAQGLRREYVRHQAELTVPRGRINIGQLARSGGVISAALPCTFYERREDTLLNQILLAGLVLAAGLTTDTSFRTRIRRLVKVLGEVVTPIHLSGQALVRAQRAISRLTVSYGPALTLIQLLWEARGLSLEDDSPQVKLPGFLFDMNQFFQALLSRFLSENISDCRLEDEYGLRDIFVYNPSHNPARRQAPTPRPDYVIWRGRELAAILDAKYRDLWATSLPAEWLYQLAIYAMSQPSARTATILYPTLASTAREARIDIQDPIDGGGCAQVILRPVDMMELDQLLCSGSGAVSDRQRRVLAARLAFGETTS